jgi:hypothetical protein
MARVNQFHARQNARMNVSVRDSETPLDWIAVNFFFVVNKSSRSRYRDVRSIHV